MQSPRRRHWPSTFWHLKQSTLPDVHSAEKVNSNMSSTKCNRRRRRKRGKSSQCTPTSNHRLTSSRRTITTLMESYTQRFVLLRGLNQGGSTSLVLTVNTLTVRCVVVGGESRTYDYCQSWLLSSRLQLELFVSSFCPIGGIINWMLSVCLSVCPSVACLDITREGKGLEAQIRHDKSQPHTGNPWTYLAVSYTHLTLPTIYSV